MPRGDDEAGNEATVASLADEFGSGAGRAEDLIQASRKRYSGDLSVAQLKDIDQEATDELHEKGFGDVAKSAGVKKDEVSDATVRGEYVVYTTTDEDGRTHKGAVPLDDLGKSGSGTTASKTSAKKSESKSGAKASGSG